VTGKKKPIKKRSRAESLQEKGQKPRPNLRFPWAGDVAAGEPTLGDRLTSLDAAFPSAPITERDLFAGRASELDMLIGATDEAGQHVIVFGERGVGKTSLANVAARILHFRDPDVVTPAVSCTAGDNFTTIWHRVFEQVPTVPSYRPGFAVTRAQKVGSLADELGSGRITPAMACARLALVEKVRSIVVILDEFDRLRDPDTSVNVADVIKMLADSGAKATLVLVGVADTIDALIAEHGSIDRAIVQVRMPRMSDDELAQIIQRGLSRVRIGIEPDARANIIALSQGLPFYTHQLTKIAAKRTIREGRSVIGLPDLQAAVRDAVARRQGSIASLYTRAVASPQRDHLFAEVLLACALAEIDERGFFSPGSLRPALTAITGRDYKVATFQRHLLQFCEPGRGPVLEREGTARRYRFRFCDPLTGPFVLMRGIAGGAISSEEAVRRSGELSLSWRRSMSEDRKVPSPERATSG